MNDYHTLYKHQQHVDQDQIRLLAIFHFVTAGFALLGILFLFGHFAFVNLIFSNHELWNNQKHGPPPAEIIAIINWLYLFFGVWSVALSILNLLSGIWLQAKKHRTFSMVVAAINCLNVPLGTVLGVFTIVVLARNSVQTLYQQHAAQTAGR